MVSKVLLTSLVALVAQALANAPAARQDPPAPCCLANPGPHTWSHARPSAGGKPFADSQATMQCDFEAGTITVNVVSPPETTHIEIRALHRATGRNAVDDHEPYEDDLCWTATNKGQHQSLGGSGGQPVIDPIYDDPFAQSAVVPDLNADYAAQWQKDGAAQPAVSGDPQAVTLRFTADSKRCGSVKSRGAFVEGPECYKRGQIVVAVKEFIKIDDIIELVTITHLTLSCGVGITQPNNAVPVHFMPAITTAETAKCQTSRYSVSARPDAANEQIIVDITGNVHPAQDSLVGWQIDSLSYAKDPIVVDHATTEVGNAIYATLRNSVQGPAVETSAWTSNPAAYRVITDSVVDKGSNKAELDVTARVNYCANAVSGGLICVDPSVPAC